MPNYNKVILMGNLTRDPEMGYTPNQTPVTNFGLAVNRKYGQHEETAFVDCTAFGKTGELVNQFLHKGEAVHCEGRLRYSKWTAQDGSNRSKLEVVVENIHFLGNRNNRQQQQPLPPQQPYQTPPPQQQYQAPPSQPQHYQQSPPPPSPQGPPPPPTGNIPF